MSSFCGIVLSYSHFIRNEEREPMKVGADGVSMEGSGAGLGLWTGTIVDTGLA